MLYQIGLAARVFDPEGALLLPWRDGTDTGSLRRRMTRTATLDGGVSVVNRGFTDADRTLSIAMEGAEPALVDKVKRMLRLHGSITVMLNDGAYTGAPREYDERRQTLVVLLTGTA